MREEDLKGLIKVSKNLDDAVFKGIERGKKEKKLNQPLPILITLGGINKFYNRKGK